MDLKYKVGITVVVVAVVFAAGRYSAPEKIKIETKIVEVEKKVEDTDQKKIKDTHKKTTTIVVKKADGTETTTSVTTDDSVVKDDKTTKITDDISKTSDIVKEESKSTSHLNLALLGGTNVLNPSSSGIIYGASASRNLVGPITVGLWGLNSGIGGMSIGLEF